MPVFGHPAIDTRVGLSKGRGVRLLGYIPPSSVPLGPVASFTWLPATGPSPLTVQFTDTSIAGAEPITLWYWNFGDGGNSTLQNPQHTFYFSDAGGPVQLGVELTVTTSIGSCLCGLIIIGT